MTKEELEKATGQELIEQRDYCGVDGYYGDYLDNVNAEMLKRFKRLAELEAQIEKMKKYGKLLQDICVVMGNDPYMVWRGLEQRVLILWDKSEEEEGLKMAENILDRLLKIKPHEWAEIDEWEIKEKNE